MSPAANLCQTVLLRLKRGQNRKLGSYMLNIHPDVGTSLIAV